MRPLRILCIGGAAVDHIYEAERPLALHCSNPVSGRSSFGGVARNAAEVLARLGAEALLASVIGDDGAGGELTARAKARGIDISLLRQAKGKRTASYVAAFHGGELFTAFADMDIFDELDIVFIGEAIAQAGPIDGVLADCNLKEQAIAAVRRHCLSVHLPLAIDTVSPAKAVRLGEEFNGVIVLFTNRAEAETLTGAVHPENAAKLLQKRGAVRVVVSDGPHGCHCCDEQGHFHVPMPQTLVRNVNGAGDALAAGSFLKMLEGARLAEAVRFGMACAQAALEQPGAEATGLDRREAERRGRMITQTAPC